MRKLDKIKFNLDILKQCREQLNLPLKQVAKRVKIIEDIENGKAKISWDVLDRLASLYCVPRWIFTQKKIPKKYNYSLRKSFIALAKYKEFRKYDFKRLVLEVEDYRDFFIEGRKDSGMPVSRFSHKLEEQIVDSNFPYFRERIDNKNVLVFLFDNSKLNFESFCIYYPVAPIIVLNNNIPDEDKSTELFSAFIDIEKKETLISNFKGYKKSHTEEKKDKVSKIINKFGKPLLRTIFALYNRNELTLTKCCSFLKIYNTNLFFEVREKI